MSPPKQVESIAKQVHRIANGNIPSHGLSQQILVPSKNESSQPSPNRNKRYPLRHGLLKVFKVTLGSSLLRSLISEEKFYLATNFAINKRTFYQG